jgi:DNA invertase Pin-like site-specific DNA recombinase
MPELLRAAVYNRVSDDRNGRSKSPQQQNEENLAAARDEGWTVAASYTEPESASASRFARKAREEWERLTADLKAGKLDVVVVWETSRSARRMAPFVDLLDACRERGVLIHVTSHDRTYDPGQWRDRKALLEDGIDAEGESEKTSLRVTRDARARAAAGKPHGRLLYGYRREYDPATREFIRQVPREDQAAVVREVFGMFAAGKSLHSIALGLNVRGVPVAYRRDPAKRTVPGVPAWDAMRLRQMARNPGYIAKRTSKGQIVGDAIWPPLVDEETFWTVQRRLEDVKRRMNHGNVQDKWLLSGVARCAVCGAYVRCVPNHNHRNVYQCRGRGGDSSKGLYCTSIVAAVFEAYVIETVIERLSRDDARGLFTADRSADAAAANTALLAKKEELEDLHRLVDRGELTIAALARHEPRLVAEIRDLEGQARSYVAPIVRDVAGPGAAKRWEQLALDQRKELLLNVADIELLKAESRADRIDVRWPDRIPGQVARRVRITWKTS